MFLTGTYRRSLDDKLRLVIPKPLREALGYPTGKVLYAAPGTDCSLALYPEESFLRLADRLGQGSPNATNVRAFSRLFYAQAQRIDLDRQCRVRLPAELAGPLGLAKEVALLGVGDHLEVWNFDQWESYLGSTQPRYDEIAELAFCRESEGVSNKLGPASAASRGSEGADLRPSQPK